LYGVRRFRLGFNWPGRVGWRRPVGSLIRWTVRWLSRVWRCWLGFNWVGFNWPRRVGWCRPVGALIRWTVRRLRCVWRYRLRFNWVGFHWPGRVGWRWPVGALIRWTVWRLSRVWRRCGLGLGRLGRFGSRWPVCRSVRRMRCIRRDGLRRVRHWGGAIALRRLPILGLPWSVRLCRFWRGGNRLRRSGRGDPYGSFHARGNRLYLLHLRDGQLLSSVALDSFLTSFKRRRRRWRRYFGDDGAGLHLGRWSSGSGCGPRSENGLFLRHGCWRKGPHRRAGYFPLVYSHNISRHWLRRCERLRSRRGDGAGYALVHILDVRHVHIVVHDCGVVVVVHNRCIHRGV
jgi:hypothetical protein